MDHIGLFDSKVLEAYRSTTFCVKDDAGQVTPFTVKNSHQFPVLKSKRFAVITAFNPMNVIKSQDENKQNNQRLETELKMRSYVYYPTSGSLGDHVEDSFTIEDIPQDEATALGKQFAQYAILFNDEMQAKGDSPQWGQVQECPTTQSKTRPDHFQMRIRFH